MEGSTGATAQATKNSMEYSKSLQIMTLVMLTFCLSLYLLLERGEVCLIIDNIINHRKSASTKKIHAIRKKRKLDV